MHDRKAKVERKTREVRVTVELDLDGTGRYQVDTGIPMLNHLLEQIARHGNLDLRVEAQGDLALGEHHTVEDVALSLGQALRQALGEREGIARMGHALVPMDEALALAAVDLSGRGYAVVEATFNDPKVGGLPTTLIGHFLESLAIEGRFNLHAKLLSGQDDHHRAEALFKALGRALDQATRLDPRRAGQIPSTKGKLDLGPEEAGHS